jgi:hypothetical protein
MAPLCQSVLSAFHDCEDRSDLCVVSFYWPSLNVGTQLIERLCFMTAPLNELRNWYLQNNSFPLFFNEK